MPYICQAGFKQECRLRAREGENCACRCCYYGEYYRDDSRPMQECDVCHKVKEAEEITTLEWVEDVDVEECECMRPLWMCKQCAIRWNVYDP